MITHEYPGPAVQALYPIHKADGICQQTGEGPSKRRGTKEETDPQLKFVARIPEG